MKERPIIFSGPMVQAILDDCKTVTRRPIRSQPPALTKAQEVQDRCTDSFSRMIAYSLRTMYQREWIKDNVKCPYGVPGDELWVREAFCEVEWITHRPYQVTREMAIDAGDTDLEGRWRNGPAERKREIYYKADGLTLPLYDRWKPSIHMPREASRIQLVVKSVRAERLQDITEEDAWSEGVECRCDVGNSEYDQCCLSARDHFWVLWDKMYAKKPELDWDANPWVWRVEFERKAP